MALGGVDMGSIKANEQAIVIGMVNIKGCMPRPLAILIIIGSIKVTAAMFDMISVRNKASAVASTINIHASSWCKDCNCNTRYSLKPESIKPFDIASPPPNNNSMLQGRGR